MIAYDPWEYPWINQLTYPLLLARLNHQPSRKLKVAEVETKREWQSNLKQLFKGLMNILQRRLFKEESVINKLKTTLTEN